MRDALRGAALQREVRREAIDRLTIRASVAGTLASPMPVPLVREDGRKAYQWNDTPLAAANLASYLERGTHLGTLVAGETQEVLSLVPSADLPRIELGAPVRLLIGGSAIYRGTVRRIGSGPIDRVPETLAVGNLVPIDPLASTPRQPLDTLYAVHVEMAETQLPIPIRSTAQARIRVASEGLWVRLWRFIRTAMPGT